MSQTSEETQPQKTGAAGGRPGPVLLIIRDGWGRNPRPEHDPFNAIVQADTPRCDALLETYPWTLIHTSGEDVGLPEGTMGNSEVGHQNLGAGRIVHQESVRITRAIRDGSFFDNEVLGRAVDGAKERGGAVHLLGIASDAGVHGLLSHLYACLELCRRRGCERVFLHLFTDGRDSGPYTGKGYVEEAVEACREAGVGRVATLCGRYWAMDRDNRWNRVRRAYDALTGRGEAVPGFDSAVAAMEDSYEHPEEGKKGDEFVTPRTIGDPESSRIRGGDAVIFTNYRGDRPREITKAFVLDDFEGAVDPSPEDGARGFDRGERLDLDFVTMTGYQEELAPFVSVAFPKPPRMKNIAGKYLSDLGKTQLRTAETEKFAHVTFFFNDYRDAPFPGESRKLAQSPKVPTYDLKPEMSAREITDGVLARLEAEDCEDFILVNFANTDMVGHTGVLEAAIRAAETVDGCVGELLDAALARGGRAVVTADHGNAEQMWDPETDAPHTAHTTYDVEVILVDPERTDDATGSPREPSPALAGDGRLADVFPTVLELMGLPAPEEMTGRSLLRGER